MDDEVKKQSSQNVTTPIEKGKVNSIYSKFKGRNNGGRQIHISLPSGRESAGYDNMMKSQNSPFLHPPKFYLESRVSSKEGSSKPVSI